MGKLNKYEVVKQSFYRGSSMKGTFRQGDGLAIESASLSALWSGDIVVFARQRDDQREEVVHRVVRRIPGGVITRGDASAYEDAGIVTDQNLVGRVSFKTRHGRTSWVYGGRIGLWRGRTLHFYWGLRRKAVRWIQKPYGRLRESGIAGRFWQPRIRRVMIQSAEGPCIQYIWKKRIVARAWPEQERFECRKPWDLVIRDFSSA